MRPDGTSKGIGFVEFATPKEAKKAMDAENGNNFEGRNLKVNFSGDKPANDFGGKPNGGSGGDSSTIFVGNLGFNTTADTIREFFSECGDIKDVRIPFHDDGRAKGFGHVEFESPEAA